MAIDSALIEGSGVVLNLEYVSLSRVFISARAKLNDEVHSQQSNCNETYTKDQGRGHWKTYCFPTQPLPPFENANKSRRLSASPSGSNHRSGSNASGFGKTCVLIR